MFNLRLKQAETALREGRLDEAAALLTDPALREHRDGQTLITELVVALLDRAAEHHAAQRHSEAQQDVQAARQFGGNATRIAELQAELDQASAKSDRVRRREQELLSEAKREVEAGNCELGEQLLQRAASEESTAQRLGDQLVAKRSRIEAAAERAEQLVESGRTNDAVGAIAELHDLCPKHGSLSSLVDRVTGPVVDQILGEVEFGRLDRVQSLMERVRPLVSLDPDLGEFDQVVELGRAAARSFDQSHFEEALKSLRKLSALLPETEWLKTLQERTQQASVLKAELQASPLSLLSDASVTSTDLPRFNVRSQDHVPVSSVHRAALNAPPMSQRLLLQIDGSGSALLLTSSSLSIGNAAGSRRCDVPLMGYNSDSPALLTRHRDGYQVVAGGDCSVDGVKCREKLLPADAKLSFGPRCSLRFRRPTSVSRSASMDLTGTRLSRPDIRTVVMFDETLIAGAARTSHVVSRSLDEPIVLFQRDGRFFARNGFAARGAGQDPIVPIPVELGESVDVAGVRLRLSPVEL